MTKGLILNSLFLLQQSLCSLMFEAFRSECESSQKQLFSECVVDLEWRMARRDIPCEHQELVYTVGLHMLFVEERKFPCCETANWTTMRRQRVGLQPR
jgi:hypothetical protein